MILTTFLDGVLLEALWSASKQKTTIQWRDSISTYIQITYSMLLRRNVNSSIQKMIFRIMQIPQLRVFLPCVFGSCLDIIWRYSELLVPNENFLHAHSNAEKKSAAAWHRARLCPRILFTMAGSTAKLHPLLGLLRELQRYRSPAQSSPDHRGWPPHPKMPRTPCPTRATRLPHIARALWIP